MLFFLLFLCRNNAKHKIAQQAQTLSHHSQLAQQNGLLSQSSGIIINPMEQYEEMKCIPELSDTEIEIVRKQWGQSRYGEILLGRFR